MSSEFVRLSHSERIYGQKHFIQSQLEFLNLIKNFRTYKQLRNEEFALKVSLKASIGEAFDLIEKLDSKLPKTDFKMPRGVKSIDKRKKKEMSIQEEMDVLKGKLASLQSGM